MIYFYNENDAHNLASEWANTGKGGVQVLPAKKPVWQMNTDTHPAIHGWVVVMLSDPQWYNMVCTSWENRS